MMPESFRGPARLFALAALLVAPWGGAVAQVRLPTAPPPPSSLTAVPSVPTLIVLTWPAVSGANGYRVTYTDNKWMGETTLFEGRSSTFAVDPTMCAIGTPCTYIASKAVLPFLWSYRVYAIFYSTIGPLISEPSPVASARSAPFEAPTALTFTVAPSATGPGLLTLTVRWNPVPNGSKYSATVNNGKGYFLTKTVSGPSVVFDPVKPRSSYTVCVYTIYTSQVTGASIFDPKAAGCIPIAL